MKSRLGAVLREERERVGLSQSQVAAACNVDRSMISNYERGVARIPKDVVSKAIRVLGSRKLQAQKCFECQVNALAMPYLDKVDMHPMTVLNVLLEELEEAKYALKTLELANKRSGRDLTDQDRESMAYAAEQSVDLLAGINTLLSSWHDWYDFDVDEQAAAGCEKLFERGYATRQSYEPAGAFA